MSRALNVRLTDGLFQWLKSTSRITGMPVSRIVREHLEDAKAKEGSNASFGI